LNCPPEAEFFSNFRRFHKKNLKLREMPRTDATRSPNHGGFGPGMSTGGRQSISGELAAAQRHGVLRTGIGNWKFGFGI